MRRRLLTLALAASIGLAAAACGDADDTDKAVNTDTLSRAQKDSMLMRTGVPGSKGIGRAMDAAAAANARSAAHDSLLQQ